MNKSLPHNLEAERALLGGLISDWQAFPDVGLAPDDFYSELHRPVYAAMQSLDAANIPCDTTTLADQLAKDGNLERLGGQAFVMDLSLDAGLNPAHYAAIIRELAQRRRLIQTAGGIMERAQDDADDSGTLTAWAQDQFAEIFERDASVAVSGDAAARDAARIVKDAMAGKRGLKIPIPWLDNHTNGLYASRLIVIGGATGSGKSVMLTNMAYECAKVGRVAYFSLEMDAPEITLRQIANVGNLSYEKLLRGKGLQSDEVADMERAMESVAKANIVYLETEDQSVADIRATCRRLHRESQGLAAVFIDYLQLCQPPDAKSQSREQEVSAIAKTLKNLAKALKIPVVTASQLNDNAAGRKGADRLPQLGDLRESKAIAQHADQVWLIHRPPLIESQCPVDMSEEEWEHCAMLRIAKNRHGRTGDSPERAIAFDGAKMRFYAPSHYERVKPTRNDDDRIPF